MDRRFADLVDVCGGKMKLKEVNREIIFWMLLKKPQRLIVDIRRRETGYYTTFYMSKKDFEGG